MSNALAGVSGFLVAQSNSFVDMGMGAGLPLVCLTALILGRSLIRSRTVISSVPPLCGLVLYFVLQQALLTAGFDLRYFMAVQAIVVIVVLGIVSRVSGRSYREVVGI
jgi:putative ABC transport system permease protein